MDSKLFNLPPVVCRLVAIYLTMEEFSKMFKAARSMYASLIASEASQNFVKCFICHQLDLPLTQT